MTTMWGIHNNQPEINPVADKAVRIGWDEMGDLRRSRPVVRRSRLPSERMPGVEEATIPLGWDVVSIRPRHG